MPNNHEAKQWSYEDFKYFMDNRNVKSKSEFVHDLNRSKGAIYAMEIIARLYAKDPSNKNVSQHMRSNFERYFNSNGKSHTEQVAVPVSDVVSATEVELRLSELDSAIDQLKNKISEVITVAVKNKLAVERESTAKELEDLRKFKTEVRQDSLFVQLTKKLNNIV